MRYLQQLEIDELSNLYREIEEYDDTLSFNIELHSLKYTRKQKKNTKTGTTLLDIHNSLSLCFPEYVFDFKDSDFKIVKFHEAKAELFNIFITMPNKYQQVYITTIHTIDKLIGVNQATIYMLDTKIGPFVNSHWFYCYFFYNKKLKKNIIISIYHKKRLMKENSM